MSNESNWSPSSWKAKHAAQVSNRHLPNLWSVCSTAIVFLGCTISWRWSPSNVGPRFLSLVKFPDGLAVYCQKWRHSPLWYHPERYVSIEPTFLWSIAYATSGLNDWGFNWRQFKETKHFFCMPEIVLKALMLVPRCVTSYSSFFFFWQRNLQENISAKLGLILSFSLILIWGARVPVVRVKLIAVASFSQFLKVRIGRIAGQYAKPRSSSTEKIGDREVLSFRFVITRIELCVCTDIQ